VLGGPVFLDHGVDLLRFFDNLARLVVCCE